MGEEWCGPYPSHNVHEPYAMQVEPPHGSYSTESPSTSRSSRQPIHIQLTHVSAQDSTRRRPSSYNANLSSSRPSYSPASHSPRTYHEGTSEEENSLSETLSDHSSSSQHNDRLCVLSSSSKTRSCPNIFGPETTPVPRGRSTKKREHLQEEKAIAIRPEKKLKKMHHNNPLSRSCPSYAEQGERKKALPCKPGSEYNLIEPFVVCEFFILLGTAPVLVSRNFCESLLIRFR